MQKEDNLKNIGNYLLDKAIGQGLYGKVRLGYHVLTDERVYDITKK